MKKLMSEAYGTELSATDKEHLIRDFFYETIVRDAARQEKEARDAKRDARARAKSRLRKSHFHRDGHKRSLDADTEAGYSEEGSSENYSVF
jgi:hypothetical protein